MLSLDLWRKENSYFEQPNVTFTNELLLELVLEDPTTGVESLQFSTIKAINQQSMNELGVPLIKASVVDSNADGLTDQIALHIEVKSMFGRGLPITQSVRNVRVLGTVDYTLKSMVQMEMVGLFQVNIDTPNGASSIKANGELLLQQTAPIHIYSIKRTLYN
jgi:Transmembrane protein 231